MRKRYGNAIKKVPSKKKSRSKKGKLGKDLKSKKRSRKLKDGEEEDDSDPDRMRRDGSSR